MTDLYTKVDAEATTTAPVAPTTETETTESDDNDCPF